MAHHPPPENIPPDELWLQLQQLPRPYRIVDFPRRDPVTGELIGKVTMRVLDQFDLMSAAAAAERRTREILKSGPPKDETSYGYDTIYNTESTIQLLFRAVFRARKVGDEWEPVNLPFFPSPEAIRGTGDGKGLTQEELGTLLRQYLIVQRELGPIVSRFDEGDLESWLEVLVKGGSRVPLARLELEAVHDLVMLLASRLYDFMTHTSSSGSPPDGSTPTGPGPEKSPEPARP